MFQSEKCAALNRMRGEALLTQPMELCIGLVCLEFLSAQSFQFQDLCPDLPGWCSTSPQRASLTYRTRGRCRPHLRGGRGGTRTTTTRTITMSPRFRYVQTLRHDQVYYHYFLCRSLSLGTSARSPVYQIRRGRRPGRRFDLRARLHHVSSPTRRLT